MNVSDYDKSLHIVQELRKVQKDIGYKNYDDAECEIKSHTSSYANMLPSEQ